MLLTYICVNKNCRKKDIEVEKFSKYEQVHVCGNCYKKLDQVISIPTVELKTDGFCNRTNK